MNFLLRACLIASVATITSTTRTAPSYAHQLSGAASWYGGKFHGRTTANGERYDMHKLTAAHKTLPFGTKVKITNQRNGETVVVRINDRGPYAGRRIIDLSRAAADKIGMLRSGVAPVKVEVVR
jgi:rare lipoprotein A